MSASNKLLGAAGAMIMALCCTLLPLAGASLGGGLIAGAGPIGIVAGVIVLAVVVALVARRRSAGRRC